MPIVKEQIITLVKESLKMLYEKDHYLLQNAPESWIQEELQKKIKLEKKKLKDIAKKEYHVGERAIVFRYGFYMQTIINEKIPELKDYNLDCEYNRDLFTVKKTLKFPNGVHPDLVVHQRGSDEHNLFIMEFKGWWNEQSNARDIDKLKELTSESQQYKYQYGFFIRFEKKHDSALIQLVEHGKSVINI